MFESHDRSFRPLDGESFSKHDADWQTLIDLGGFRPLDGESFSKLITMVIISGDCIYTFPSPRRGIIF